MPRNADLIKRLLIKLIGYDWLNEFYEQLRLRGLTRSIESFAKTAISFSVKASQGRDNTI